MKSKMTGMYRVGYSVFVSRLMSLLVLSCNIHSSNESGHSSVSVVLTPLTAPVALCSSVTLVCRAITASSSATTASSAIITSAATTIDTTVYTTITDMTTTDTTTFDNDTTATTADTTTTDTTADTTTADTTTTDTTTADTASFDTSALWWSVNSQNVSATADLPPGVNITTIAVNGTLVSSYSIGCVDTGHQAEYTCRVGNTVSQSTTLRIASAAAVLVTSSGARAAVNHSTVLLCVFSSELGHPPPSPVTWWRLGRQYTAPATTATTATATTTTTSPDANYTRASVTVTNTVTDSIVESRLTLTNVTRQNGGLWQCRTANISESVQLTVVVPPTVANLTGEAVGKSRIYVTWTVDTGNAPIINYTVQYAQIENDSVSVGWVDRVPAVPPDTLSAVITGLLPATGYTVRVRAANAAGAGSFVQLAGSGDANATLTTSDTDALYQPTLSLKAATSESLTVNWDAPPPALAHFVHYYRLLLADQHTASGNLIEADADAGQRAFVWRALDPGRAYTVSVRACNRHVQLCGLWSSPLNGTTLLDHAAVPRDVTMQCQLDRQSPYMGRILVTWLSPLSTDTISQYSVQVTGRAEYIGAKGSRDVTLFGPEYRSLPVGQTKAIFTVPPNTNYTVEVCAMAGGRCRGVNSAECRLGAGVPTPQQLQLVSSSWWRVQQQQQHQRWVLLLQVDRVDERNGPICCYRVVLVLMSEKQSVRTLPPPDQLTLLTYDQVQQQGHGAYVVDMFHHDFIETRYVTLGDGETLSSSLSRSTDCYACTAHLVSSAAATTPATTAATTTSTLSPLPPSPQSLTMSRKSRDSAATATNVTASAAQTHRDGPLLQHARYTAFVQLLVRDAGGSLLVLNTGYLPALTPAPASTGAAANSSSSGSAARSLTVTVLGVVCALGVCALLVTAALCVLLRHYGKQYSGPVPTVVRLMLERVHRQPLAVPPPSLHVPPVARDQLVAAYQQRHADSDAGFRREFECLPQTFADRTTHASEALENYKKNRYPDIRAYDQTRVKLAQQNNVQSTEYINANYVYSYKERKKFICAQGPLETTVDDFWRLVWEQGCELMVMLTNLEEVGRSKCAKYWPDHGETVFGTVTVSLADEKAFSDYIQRVLSVSHVRADGTSEQRRITHLHYLLWKDFMAPEHPTGLLRFVRRINELYGLEMGPILVHCSAGVGRTGTLVAIDWLLQQLAEEGQVAVFETVCDLRHQRNYLVQSLKQYVFVYRALMEMAQFGDTQLEATKLALTYRSLCGQLPTDRTRTKLSDEFRRLGDVIEERRSFVVGSSEENGAKNRYDYIVPYDANRVILAPIVARPMDTYINASFLQGYDISETYVVTQHPLADTRADFWRMLFDLEVPAVVMLSEAEESDSGATGGATGGAAGGAAGDECGSESAPPLTPPPAAVASDDRCVIYWPAVDQQLVCDHLCVHCVSEQTVCDYLQILHVSITNTKSKECVNTQLLKFTGWTSSTTAAGPPADLSLGSDDSTPEAPRDAALPVSVAPLAALMARCSSAREGVSGPIVVHCSDGGFRCGVLVALFNLLRQLDTERAADVFQTVRQLRSQRQAMIQHLAQYDFLYRALIEYLTLSSSTGGSTANGHIAC